MRVYYSLYDRLLDVRALARAFVKVRHCKGAPGNDGQTIGDFASRLQEELEQLMSELRDKTTRHRPCEGFRFRSLTAASGILASRRFATESSSKRCWTSCNRFLSLVTMPTPPSSGGTPHVSLNDVHAFAPDDVWAVGSNPPASTGSAAVETLVYHWNGLEWSIVPSPIGCCGSFGSQFYSVDGVSSDDFWAVGYKANEVAAGALAAHWNGSNWEEHLLPVSTGNVNALKDLHVIASDDIWALEGVGVFPPTTPRRIFHWDGSSWSEGAPQINGVLYTGAEAIFAFNSDDIWISSFRFSSAQTVMLHYDGSSWTEMNVPVFAYEFFGNAPNDLYAVGNTSMMHWDGSSWTVVDTLDGAPQGNCFDAELAADGTLWCAGNTQPGPSSQTLTAHFQFCPVSLVGDINGDGVINLLDVAPFVDLITNGNFQAEGDINSDGVVDLLDVAPFVGLLSGG